MVLVEPDGAAEEPAEFEPAEPEGGWLDMFQPKKVRARPGWRHLARPTQHFNVSLLSHLVSQGTNAFPERDFDAKDAAAKVALIKRRKEEEEAAVRPEHTHTHSTPLETAADPLVALALSLALSIWPHRSEPMFRIPRALRLPGCRRRRRRARF